MEREELNNVVKAFNVIGGMKFKDLTKYMKLEGGITISRQQLAQYISYEYIDKPRIESDNVNQGYYKGESIYRCLNLVVLHKYFRGEVVKELLAHSTDDKLWYAIKKNKTLCGNTIEFLTELFKDLSATK